MPDIDFQRIELNVIPKKGDEPVIFYASQYETARPFIADLFWGDTEFAPGDDCYAEIDIRKNDNNLVVITDDVAFDNNEVSVILPVQALTCIGKNLGQVKIYGADDHMIATLNFLLEVQPDPLAGGVDSETAIDNLTTQIDDIISGEGYVKDTDLDVLQSDWDEADPTSPAYIKNKPSSSSQVQADWTEADTTSPAYIKNKPLLPFESKGQYLIKATPAIKRSIEFTKLIGGTCGVNQLVNGLVSSTTQDGLIFTNNNDGSISISGTASVTGSYNITNNVSIPRTNEVVFFNFVFSNALPTGNYVYLAGYGSTYAMTSTGRLFKRNDGSAWNNPFAIHYENGAEINTRIYCNVHNLTQMFGTTIADYVYTLEKNTSGAGVAWLKNNGFFGADYYTYNAGGLLSVKTSKKINRDSNNVIVGEYPLDDIELRGILKLDGNNNLYYDGDTYNSSGEVVRRFEYRAYASGDESLPDTITDGTNTVTKLVTPTTETADTFTNPMVVDGNGTEEFVDGRTVEMPVGHDTFYIPMN